MRIEKTLITAGLKASNKEDWAGNVLLFPNERQAVMEDRNITEVKFDHNDGNGNVVYSGDKIRSAKTRFVESKSGTKFYVYDAEEIK